MFLYLEGRLSLQNIWSLQAAAFHGEWHIKENRKCTENIKILVCFTEIFYQKNNLEILSTKNQKYLDTELEAL